jgi:hypothetical protein
LSIGGNLALVGHVVQVGFNLLLPHIFWMAFFIKKNELTNPEDIGFFSFGTELFLPANDSNLL